MDHTTGKQRLFSILSLVLSLAVFLTCYCFCRWAEDSEGSQTASPILSLVDISRLSLAKGRSGSF